jgi:hypothetical protein
MIETDEAAILALSGRHLDRPTGRHPCKKQS